MTARRDVPFSPDALGWVHGELAEIKSKLALTNQTAEQSRGLAADASERTQRTDALLESLAGYAAAMGHLQEGLRVLSDQLVRAQEDIHSLRQSREEMERQNLTEVERARQERNDAGRRFGEAERAIEGWQERLVSTEEHNRRNLESIALLTMRLETLTGGFSETETLQSRFQAQVSHIENELSRLSSGIAVLQREDEVQRERTESALEMLRRLESGVETAKEMTNRLSRLDDRLELVQAERTRHNERLNDLTTQLGATEARLNEQAEKATLIETRMTGYQEGLRTLDEKLRAEREQLAAYVSGLAELEADFRKRQAAALENETRDLRSRALRFSEE